MTRIGMPLNERSRRTRAAILDAASTLLEQGGSEALSMEAVAERAGVTRRALYLHFTSRTELLLSLREHIDATLNLGASLRPIVDAPDGIAMLRAWTRHLATYHPRILKVVEAIARARGSDPDAARVWNETMEAWHGGCRRIASRLASEGRLAEPWTSKTAADMLWALMSPDLLQSLTAGRGWSTALFGERLFTLVARALVREPAARSRTTRRAG